MYLSITRFIDKCLIDFIFIFLSQNIRMVWVVKNRRNEKVFFESPKHITKLMGKEKIHFS